ncbi:MAPEG family protein [Paraferrimonas sp. SM1919]|uniref:MAPEG family protein n=1 Tax=Paraferrimonas sp. SM1919 TaxID=2662263 RepID=UPI0013D37432|nr:MAPEG family protein [Paraferrimonas sp. SM1919]
MLESAFTSTLLSTYSLAFWALFVIFTTVFIQSLVAMVAHRKQSQYIPGIVDEKLGQESFVFRSNRTVLNSLENIPFLAGPAFIGILTGMDPSHLAVLLWVFAIARIIHMVLYYKIATNANPSPRSHFFAIGFLTNLVLLVMLGVHLAS